MKTIDFHTHLLSKDVSFDRLYDKVALTIFAKSFSASEDHLIGLSILFSEFIHYRFMIRSFRRI